MAISPIVRSVYWAVRCGAIAALVLLLASGGDGAARAERFTLVAGIELGMSAADLRAARPDLRALQPAWDFGPLLGAYRIDRVEVYSHPFAAYLQLDRQNSRLRQIMLERRDATAAAHATLMADFSAGLGPPDRVCQTVIPGQPPAVRSARWRRGATVIHLVFLNFRSPGLAYFDLNTDRDVRASGEERRRIRRRTLPRRILVRLHASDDGELDSLNCPVSDLAKPGGLRDR